MTSRPSPASVTDAAGAAVPADPVPSRAWAALAIMLVGQLMGLVDVTIVNVALADIGRELDAGGAALQLVVAGYTVSYAVLLITSARLGAVLGHRRLFRTGIAVFTLASLACALAPSAVFLIVVRVVQGAGAAAMMPQVMSTIQTRFTGDARGRALAAYTAVIAAGNVIGQVLGGVLIGLDLDGLGWRWVFLVNVLPGVVGWVLLPRVMDREARRGGSPRVLLDLRGLALATTAVVLIVLPLVLGREEGWPAWMWVSLAVGVALAVAFVRVEQAVLATGGRPLLNLQVLRSRGMGVGILSLIAVMLAYGGYLFTLSVHLQLGLGDSALRTGLTFAPASVTFGLLGLFWRRLPARWHHWLAPVGLVWAAAGFVAQAVLLDDGSTGGAMLVVAIGLGGVGFGLAFGPLLAHALVHVPPDQASDASGLLTTAFQLSQVFGVAVFGTLFLNLAGSGGPARSGGAYGETTWWMVAMLLVGAVFGIALARVVRRARAEAVVAR